MSMPLGLIPYPTDGEVRAKFIEIEDIIVDLLIAQQKIAKKYLLTREVNPDIDIWSAVPLAAYGNQWIEDFVTGARGTALQWAGNTMDVAAPRQIPTTKSIGFIGFRENMILPPTIGLQFTRDAVGTQAQDSIVYPQYFGNPESLYFFKHQFAWEPLGFMNWRHYLTRVANDEIAMFGRTCEKIGDVVTPSIKTT